MAGITVDLQLSGLETLKPLLAFTDPKLLAKAVKGGIKYAAKAGAYPSSQVRRISLHHQVSTHQAGHQRPIHPQR